MGIYIYTYINRYTDIYAHHRKEQEAIDATNAGREQAIKDLDARKHTLQQHAKARAQEERQDASHCS